MRTLTPKEECKLHIITAVIQKQMKSARAAKLLGISTRQVRRLKNAVRQQGNNAVVHKLKGTRGNHSYPEAIKTTVIETIKNTYTDFKPGFATEKLQERHGIRISPETTRRWMTVEGLWKPRKQKQLTYRSWRPRKEYYGELIQFDGSYHYWFENRYADADGNPIEVCLLASIDDATGKIIKASFAANEGVIAVFQFWLGYVQRNEKPLSIYLDEFSTYKINHKNAVDNHELMTQFQRATKDLDILLIAAHSPQAKGRVERLFETLQDRLVKEMRLLGINNPEDGNRFLEEVFIPKFNNRFSVIPQKEGDVHRVLTQTDKKHLNRIFSVQSTRRVNNDFTIQFKNTWHQLAEVQPTTVRAKETALVEEWLDGKVHISLRGKYLKYIVLPERPKKDNRQPAILTTHKLNWIPPKDHPWRKPFRPRF